jgi:hypothetical protein
MSPLNGALICEGWFYKNHLLPKATPKKSILSPSEPSQKS